MYKIQKAKKAMDVESKTSSQLVLQQLSCLLWQRTQSDMCLNCMLLDLSCRSLDLSCRLLDLSLRY